MTMPATRADQPNEFDNDHMLGDDPANINAKTDNDKLAGIIPDKRLPVPPEGGSIEQSDEMFGGGG